MSQKTSRTGLRRPVVKSGELLQPSDWRKNHRQKRQLLSLGSSLSQLTHCVHWGPLRKDLLFVLHTARGRSYSWTCRVRRDWDWGTVGGHSWGGEGLEEKKFVRYFDSEKKDVEVWKNTPGRIPPLVLPPPPPHCGQPPPPKMERHQPGHSALPPKTHHLPAVTHRPRKVTKIILSNGDDSSLVERCQLIANALASVLIPTGISLFILSQWKILGASNLQLQSPAVSFSKHSWKLP